MVREALWEEGPILLDLHNMDVQGLGRKITSTNALVWALIFYGLAAVILILLQSQRRSAEQLTKVEA